MWPLLQLWSLHFELERSGKKRGDSKIIWGKLTVFIPMRSYTTLWAFTVVVIKEQSWVVVDPWSLFGPGVVSSQCPSAHNRHFYAFPQLTSGDLVSLLRSICT